MILAAVTFGLVASVLVFAWIDYRRICRRDALRHAVSTHHAGRSRLGTPPTSRRSK